MFTNQSPLCKVCFDVSLNCLWMWACGPSIRKPQTLATWLVVGSGRQCVDSDLFIALIFSVIVFQECALSELMCISGVCIVRAFVCFRSVQCQFLWLYFRSRCCQSFCNCFRSMHCQSFCDCVSGVCVVRASVIVFQECALSELLWLCFRSVHCQSFCDCVSGACIVRANHSAAVEGRLCSLAGCLPEDVHVKCELQMTVTGHEDTEVDL